MGKWEKQRKENNDKKKNNRKESKENTHAMKRKICIIIAIAHASGIKHSTPAHRPILNSICPARK